MNLVENFRSQCHDGSGEPSFAWYSMMQKKKKLTVETPQKLFGAFSWRPIKAFSQTHPLPPHFGGSIDPPPPPDFPRSAPVGGGFNVLLWECRTGLRRGNRRRMPNGSPESTAHRRTVGAQLAEG